VALIGDSTLLGLTYNPSAGRNSDARSVIAAKYGIVWGVASCERLVAPSCGSNPPPTSLQQMQANAGQLGQVVVIMGGYDDAEIGTGVDAIVNEAARQGVGTVLWLTYRTGNLTYQYASNYVGFNAVLRPRPSTRRCASRLGRLPHDHPSETDDGVHVNSTGPSPANFILAQLQTRHAVAARSGRGRPGGGPWRSPRPPTGQHLHRPGPEAARHPSGRRRQLDLPLGPAMKVPSTPPAHGGGGQPHRRRPVRGGLPHRLPVRRRPPLARR
jgi:hypothetical protein